MEVGMVKEGEVVMVLEKVKVEYLEDSEAANWDAVVIEEGAKKVELVEVLMDLEVEAKVLCQVETEAVA